MSLQMWFVEHCWDLLLGHYFACARMTLHKHKRARAIAHIRFLPLLLSFCYGVWDWMHIYPGLISDNLGAMSVDHSAIWTREVIDRMSVAVESFFVLRYLVSSLPIHCFPCLTRFHPSLFFLYPSGALVTMSFLRALEKQNGRVTCKQMGLYYFHRYWR